MHTRLPKRRKKIPALCGPGMGRYRGRGKGRTKSKPRFGNQFYVVFRGADGKPSYELFGDDPQEAQRRYELWKLANYHGVHVSPDSVTGDLTAHALPGPSNEATFPTVLSSFMASEKDRVREEDAGRHADRPEGTLSMKEYWNLRNRLLLLADWTKEHFGPQRFQALALGKLFQVHDYTAMMAHFTTKAKPKHHGKKAAGYSSMYCKKLRLNFWQMIRHAKEAFGESLSFAQEDVKRFAVKTKAHIPEFPSLATLKRLLACADVEMRLWIWLALGCGFGPKDLAVLQRLDFDEKHYDLARTKTFLPRSGRTPPMVWAHWQQFLKHNPRDELALMFSTRNAHPIVRIDKKTPQELAMGTTTRRPALIPYSDNNALSSAWTRLRERAGVDDMRGFYTLRHIGTTVFTTREESSRLQVLWAFLGHAPGDTYTVYARLITPRTRPLIEWVSQMLDQSDINAWRDEEVMEYEALELARRERAKKNSVGHRKGKRRKLAS